MPGISGDEILIWWGVHLKAERKISDCQKAVKKSDYSDKLWKRRKEATMKSTKTPSECSSGESPEEVIPGWSAPKWPVTEGQDCDKQHVMESHPWLADKKQSTVSGQKTIGQKVLEVLPPIRLIRCPRQLAPHNQSNETLANLLDVSFLMELMQNELKLTHSLSPHGIF